MAVGDESRELPLANIAAMHLSLAEGTGGAARCVLTDQSGRKHMFSDRYWPQWKKGERRRWGRNQLRKESFWALTLPLAQELAAVNPQAVIMTGPSRAEWVASCIVAVLAIAVIIIGVGLMLANWQFPLAAMAFMGAVAAYLPMLWLVIRTGGPRPFDLDDLGDAET